MLRVILFLLLLALPWLDLPTASAHAVVTATSLATEPVRPNQPTTVVLQFNSNVELGLSQVFLVSVGDVHKPLSPKLGKRPGELRVPLPALVPGEYAIKYKVFAADGHFTENAIRFQVGE